MKPYVNPFDVNNFSLLHQAIANPAAGADYSGSSPPNSRSQLVLASFEFTSDANVASRYIYLQHDRAGTRTEIAHAWYGHVASKTYKYYAQHTFPITLSSPAEAIMFGLPNLPLWLQADTLFVRALNKQATDQFSNIRLIWKLWPYQQ